MAEAARILVTGSRHWSSTYEMRRIIHATLEEFGPDVTFVHGNATGADRLAALAAGWFGASAEAHDADWYAPCRETCQPGHREKRYGRDYCPAAGEYRDQAIVDLGAVACLAFLVPRKSSPCEEVLDFADRGSKAGIPVRWYTQESA